MHESPSVSVIIPCYNVEHYIQSSVESALNQTLAPKEVICIDDGSTDGTLSILRNLKASGKDILVRSQTNRGASAARNTGLDLCSANYVCFLDADDLLHPEKLEHQMGLVTKNSSPPDLIAGASKSVFVDIPNKPDAVDIPREDKWIGLITSSLGITSSNLWKVASVRAAGGWAENIAQSDDAELMFRMLCDGATVLCDTEVLTTLRRRGESLSNRDPAASRKAFLKLRCEMKSYLEATDQLTKDRAEAFASFFFMIRKAYHDGDPQFASRVHAELIPSDHRPDIGRLYSTLYSFFGLKGAEWVYNWYAPLR